MAKKALTFKGEDSRPLAWERSIALLLHGRPILTPANLDGAPDPEGLLSSPRWPPSGGRDAERSTFIFGNSGGSILVRSIEGSHDHLPLGAGTCARGHH